LTGATAARAAIAWSAKASLRNKARAVSICSPGRISLMATGSGAA
jgi:hypothetical protein